MSKVKSTLTKSFYLLVTSFFKLLLLVQVPYFKKNPNYSHPSPKSEPDIPPPMLTKPGKSNLTWQQIISARQEAGIKVKPIKHRANILKSFHCPDCGASYQYIYANGYSFLCSLCGRQVKKSAKKIRPQKYMSLFCPFCGFALSWKKERSFFVVYKCVNPVCPHKLKHNTRYTWRLFLVGDKLPIQNCPDSVSLSHIHLSHHILATALFFAINLHLASTSVVIAIKTLFNINISHKSIDNWKYSTASILYKFFFASKIDLPSTIVIDETYINVLGKHHYLYAALDPVSKQVIAFFFSPKRNGNASFNLFQLIHARALDPSVNVRVVTDGAPFYPAAIACSNLVLKTHFSHDIIIGLYDPHPRRCFKNMIEKLWSPLHESYKSHHGFKDFDASVAHFTLFFIYYNFFRPHLSLGNNTPASIDNINPDNNAIKNWLSILKKASTT